MNSIKFITILCEIDNMSVFLTKCHKITENNAVYTVLKIVMLCFLLKD